MDKLALVPHLKNLIETSVVGKKEDLKHTRPDGIVAFYHLYNDSVIDGKPYDVTTKIGVDENGNLFYLLLLDEKNNSFVSKTGTKSNPNKGAINLTISQSEADIKYEQAVYDDADEPFANIKISDHYTHKFYGDNIN